MKKTVLQTKAGSNQSWVWRSLNIKMCISRNPCCGPCSLTSSQHNPTYELTKQVLVQITSKVRCAVDREFVDIVQGPADPALVRPSFGLQNSFFQKAVSFLKQKNSFFEQKQFLKKNCFANQSWVEPKLGMEVLELCI